MPYNVSNSLTQAWPGCESDASVRHVLSKRNIHDMSDQSENCEHKFTLQNTKIDIWYNSNLCFRYGELEIKYVRILCFCKLQCLDKKEECSSKDG